MSALVKMMQYLSAVKLVLLQNVFWWAIMSFSLAVLLFFFIITSLAGVNVKAHGQWGAVQPKKNSKRIRKALPLVIIHHSGTTNKRSENSSGKDISCIQDYHSNSSIHKRDGIGYNFLISTTGEIFEGRGWEDLADHAGPEYDRRSVGICLLGNYEETNPSAVQLKATQELISTGVRLGCICTTYELLGHRQVDSTVCPGENLYKIIKDWPHFSSEFTSARQRLHST